MTLLQPMRLQVRSGNSLFFTPSIILDSAVNKVARKLELLAPFSSGHSFPVMGYISTPTHVIGLLFRCCPPAIIRRVITIIVDTVNRVLGGWLQTHIGKEIFKRIFPPIADSDSSTSVSRVFRVSDVVASIFYASPRVIFWSPCFAMCKPVRSQSATTRTPLSSRYSPAISNNRLPAVARKKPIASFVPILNKFYSSKFVKLISRRITSSHISPLVGTTMNISISQVTGVKTQ